MLKIRFRKQFRKDYKRVLKQPGHTPELLQEVLDYLVQEQPLPEKYVTMPYPATMPTSVSAHFA